MSLKQLNDADRILFLIEFSNELILNSGENDRLKELIKVEKIKKKYLEPEQESSFPIVPAFVLKPDDSKNFEKSISSSKLTKFYIKESSNKTYRPIFAFKPIQKHFQQIPNRLTKQYQQPIQKPFQQIPNKLTKQYQQPIQKPLQQIQHHQIQSQHPQIQPIQQNIQVIKNEPLKKIEALINDNSVQLIECPGPGKNILVKVRNMVNVTKIILSEDEIKNIINFFSTATRIPISKGILKATLDSLLISAIISDLTGSRFIMNKKSPYELIEGFNIG